MGRVSVCGHNVRFWTRGVACLHAAHRGLGPGAAGWCGAAGGVHSLCCWRRRAVLVGPGVDGVPLSDAVAGESKLVSTLHC